MITNIEELMDEDFNLRHFIQHTSIDLFRDPDVTKEELIDGVMDGIKMWKLHMTKKIIDYYADSKRMSIKQDRLTKVMNTDTKLKGE